MPTTAQTDSSAPPPTERRPNEGRVTRFAAADDYDSTPAHVRALQFAELARVSEKYGFEFMPNHGPPAGEPTVVRCTARVPTVEGTAGAASAIVGFLVISSPAVPEPRPLPGGWVADDPDPDDKVRRHFAHLRLTGTILDASYPPAPRIDEIRSLDGVPLRVRIVDEWPPLAQCIVCRGPKGESYTICAGCYTTRLRDVEHELFATRPDMEEKAIRGLQPLSKEQYVKAIRKTPRLEPVKRAWLDHEAEAVRRRLRAAVVDANRTVRLQELSDAAEEEGISEEERKRRWDRYRSFAAGWSAKAWQRGIASMSLDGLWYALLATEEQAAEERDDDDEYPVVWLDADWMQAPDRVDYVDEVHPPLIGRSNTAAGTAEHRTALQRNLLIDAVRIAERRARFGDPGASERAEWLWDRLNALGGMPPRVRARIALEWDADECDRWDRWVDAILGGEAAAAPEGLDPVDVEACTSWGNQLTCPAADESGEDGWLSTEAAAEEEDRPVVPIHLPKLDRGLPYGRIRWPQFIREEIEQEFEPWGCWVQIPENEGETVRVWTCENMRRKQRRISIEAIQPLLQRRLEEWARKGILNTGRVVGGRPKGSRAAWEREIRRERRRRRFEHMAHENARVHPTHVEAARHQAI